MTMIDVATCSVADLAAIKPETHTELQQWDQ